MTDAPKPRNVFYVWYAELCRRLNCAPSPAVRPAKPKSQTVLDLAADRLKLAEWQPVAQALRADASLHVIRLRSRAGSCPFLRDVDTEEKARLMRRRSCAIRTDYVLRTVLGALASSARSSDVLTCLELDGLPLADEYLEPLLQALRKNKSLKNLSFANSPIGDSGCQLVCSYVRFAPNVEVLDLSGCGLTGRSGEHLAKLVKHQQINRYCESWHSSLRYENPRSEAMRGLKRLTLDSNEALGDDGLGAVLDELEDDLWVRALDAQRCGVTDALAERVLRVVRRNGSLEVLDLRQNERLDVAVLDEILQVLRERQYQTRPEHQWRSTAASLTWNLRDAGSRSSFGAVHKTRSAPAQAARKAKTATGLRDADARIRELNERLRVETSKRREAEKRNEELLREVEKMKGETGRYLKRVVGEARGRVPGERSGKGYRNGRGGANGFSADACRIFEDLLRGRPREEREEVDEELLDYFLRDSSSATLTEGGAERGGSEASLRDLVEELGRVPRCPARSNRR